ncbi:MAG: hypothetical protein QGF00_30485, partial [Planctomycetota bacterium]|nr:hypothetical protein [Planctomycetota bacterium]
SFRTTVIVCLLVLTACRANAENLLTNGGFEEGKKGPEGWMFVVWSSRPSRGAFEWTSDSKTGNRAAVLKGLENAGKEAVRGLIYHRPVKVKEGLHQLSGWYRSSGYCRPHLQVHLYKQDFALKQFGTPAEKIYRHLAPSADWSPFKVDINVKPGVRQAHVFLRASDIGTVSWDDVSLVRVDNPLSVRIFPADYGRQNAVSLIPGVPNFIRFMLMGDRSRIRDSVQLLLDLPEGAGDFGLLGKAVPVTREKPYRRFRIAVPDEVLARLRKTVSGCSVTVWLDATGLDGASSLYCTPVVDGKQLPERRVALKVLPRLPEISPPKRFHSFFCWGLFNDVPEKLWPAAYSMVRGMGVDHLLARKEPKGWPAYLENGIRRDGGTLWANIPWSFVKMQRKKAWETGITGTKTALSELSGDHYQQMAAKVDGVFWDYEPANGMRNPLWDDPATVAAFASRAGLKPDEVTEDRLKGELREKFMKFRTWQLAQVLRLWAEHVRSIGPELDIAVCQGSGMPPDRAVDYQAYNNIPDLIHLPMIYTASAMAFANNVEGMRSYLPKAKIFPMTSTSMVADSGWMAAKMPRRIYFDWVSAALLGCMGCSHWPGPHRGFDMEYIWEVSQATHHISLVEDFLFDGVRNPAGVEVRPLPESEARIRTAKGELVIQSPQWDRHARSYTHRLEDRSLVSVCNMHGEKPAFVEVSVRDATGDSWRVRDPVSDAVLVPDKTHTVWPAARLKRGFLFEVPSQTLGMFVIEPGTGKKAPAKLIHESEIRRRFKVIRDRAQAAGTAAMLREGNLEINWADLDGDGSAEIRMASSHHEIALGSSGNLWSWKPRGLGADLVSRFDVGGACQDQFWWPEAARSSDDKRSEYQLVTREIKGGRATVVFRRQLSHWALGGLVVEKAYSLRDASPAIEVRVTFRNESPKPQEVSYWSHNCFSIGPTPALGLTTEKGLHLWSGDQQPREIWSPRHNLPAEQRNLVRVSKMPALRGPTFLLGDRAGPHIKITTEFNSLLQVYRWWDGTRRGRYTMEWMYQKQKLASNHTWTTRFLLEARNVEKATGN